MRLVDLIRGCDPARAFPGASPDVEVERSVWDRLYGERAEVTATPIPHGAAPLGRLVGGRYRLVERLGAGGMATVYRARDEQLERDVAVKVIAERHARDPLFVRRFRSEAQLGARLAHPHIVAVLDAGAQPRDFIVTELVLGLDAATPLRGRGRLTPGETVDIDAQVCDALAHPHGRAVVHRDVSPSNILIAEADDTAKLADFGLASDALESPTGRVHRVTGPLGYVAPEIVCQRCPTPVRACRAACTQRFSGRWLLNRMLGRSRWPSSGAQLLDRHMPSRGAVVPFPDAVRSQLRSAA